MVVSEIMKPCVDNRGVVTRDIVVTACWLCTLGHKVGGGGGRGPGTDKLSCPGIYVVYI